MAIRINRKYVTAIIPAKNEAQGLRKIISTLKPFAEEIIVVDGHSKDKTREIVERQGAKYFLDNKKGKGDAIRIGIKKAKNDYLLFVDADGSHDFREVPLLLTPLFNNDADVVVGSRRTGGSFDLNMDFWGILRSAGSDTLTYIVNRHFHTKLSDVISGFRTIKRSKALRLGLRSNGFDIEQELIVKTLKKKYRLMEVPTREYERKWGKSKLKTITGVKLFFLLLKEIYL